MYIELDPWSILMSSCGLKPMTTDFFLYDEM